MELRIMLILSLNFLSGALASTAVELETVTSVREKYGKDFQENTECGGTLDSVAGLISYKLNEDITPNHTCIWTVVNKQQNEIRMRFLQDGFIKYSHGNLLGLILWRGIPREREKLIGIQPGFNGSINIRYSFFQVAFTSYLFGNQTKIPQGFAILYERVEMKNLTRFALTPHILEQDGKEEGVVEYSTIPTQIRKLVTMVLHPPMGRTMRLTLEYLRNGNPNTLPFCLNEIMAFTVKELLVNLSTGIRLRECMSTNRSVTIYSRAPLIINFLRGVADEGEEKGQYGFRFSFQTVDD